MKKKPNQDKNINVSDAVDDLVNITEIKHLKEESVLLHNELDITLLHLKETEEKLEMIIDAAKIGAWELDIAHDTSWRTLYHDQIFGYDALLPEWGYKIFSKHVIPEDLAYVKKRFEEGFSKGKFSMECRIRRVNDKSIRWISAEGVGCKNEKGKVIKLKGIVKDITKEKNLEIKAKDVASMLFQSVEQIKLILENIGEGVVAIDKNMKIILSNRMAEEIIGVRKNEGLSVPVDWVKDFDLYNVDGKSTFPAQHLPLTQAIRGEVTNEVEIIIDNKISKVRKQIKVNGQPIIDINDNIIGAITTFKDITKLTELTHDLEESEKKYRTLIGFKRNDMH